MRLNIYTIFDMATATYSKPFFAQADGEAIRNFSDFAQDKDSFVGKHPEDYTLYRIGTYDDQKATLHPEELQKMATALELVAATRKVDPAKHEQMEKSLKPVPANAGRHFS